MTTSELKTSIIDEVNKTDDLEKLEVLKEFVESLKSEPPVLSEWQLKRIEESEKQIERGEFYTEEEANKITEKWFEGK